jgi:hypothetical protein
MSVGFIYSSVRSPRPRIPYLTCAAPARRAISSAYMAALRGTPKNATAFLGTPDAALANPAWILVEPLSKFHPYTGLQQVLTSHGFTRRRRPYLPGKQGYRIWLGRRAETPHLSLKGGEPAPDLIRGRQDLPRPCAGANAVGWGVRRSVLPFAGHRGPQVDPHPAPPDKPGLADLPLSGGGIAPHV